MDNYYEDLVKRLNEYSSSYQYHGGIAAEAADAIQDLQRRLEKDREDIEFLKKGRQGLLEESREVYNRISYFLDNGNTVTCDGIGESK